MSEEQIVKFNIDVINDYLEDEDLDFSIMKLKFLSDGNNSHGIPISTSMLEQYAPTIIGKPIVAKYNRYINDVEGHETDESVVGVIPNNAEIYWEETDNGKFACVDGVIFKLYAPDIYNIYKDKNGRNVSVEMTIDYQNNDPRLPVTGINIRAVTLLGLKYEPSCTLASSEIIQFSKANDFYENRLKTSDLKNYAERRKSQLAEKKTYKIDKSRDSVSNTSWGDVDKTDLQHKVMNAANRGDLVHSVYLQVKSGWEDTPSEKLKYPVMQLKGDTFVYNKGGISSARGYAETNDPDIAKKAINLQKKLGLNEEGESKTMAEEMKKNETKTDDQKAKEEKLAEELATANSKHEAALTEMEEKYKKELSDKDEIIMGQSQELEKQGQELEQLKQFKDEKEKEQKDAQMNETLAEVKQFVSEEEYVALQKEAEECNLEALSGWSNKAKALAFSKTKEVNPATGEILRMGIPKETTYTIEDEDTPWAGLK